MSSSRASADHSAAPGAMNIDPSTLAVAVLEGIPGVRPPQFWLRGVRPGQLRCFPHPPRHGIADAHQFRTEAGGLLLAKCHLVDSGGGSNPEGGVVVHLNGL